MKLSTLTTKVTFGLLSAAVLFAATPVFADGPTSAKAPAVSTPSATTTAPAEPPNPVAAGVVGIGLSRELMVNILMASGGMHVFDEFWGFVVVQRELNDQGIKLPESRTQKLKDDLVAKIAPDVKFTGVTDAEKKTDQETKNQIITAQLYKQGITTNPEIEWYFGTYAGLQILAENAEMISKGSATTLTADEMADSQKVAFGEFAVVLDFICKDTAEANDVIKALKVSIKPDAIQALQADKHSVQQLRIAHADKSIPEEFQKEIWDNLKGAKDAFSSVATLDKRSNYWHVLLIQTSDKGRDMKDVKPAEIKALLDGLAERKAAQWRSTRLETLKRNSNSTIVMNDPILKQQLEAMRSNAEKAATQRTGATSMPAATNPK